MNACPAWHDIRSDLVQETGRAGRDNKMATCIMYYSYGDAQKMRHMLKQRAEENGTSKEQMQHNTDSLNSMVDCLTNCAGWCQAKPAMCSNLVYYIALCSAKNNVSGPYQQEVKYLQLFDDWTYFHDLLLESNPADVHLHCECKSAVLINIQAFVETVQLVYFYPDMHYLSGV